MTRSPGPSSSQVPVKRSGNRRLDLVIGILVGVVLGLSVLAAFVFLGSEGTIDAPRISGSEAGKPAQQAQPVETAPAEKR